jgi:hypothetical protein
MTAEETFQVPDELEKIDHNQLVDIALIAGIPIGDAPSTEKLRRRIRRSAV